MEQPFKRASLADLLKAECKFTEILLAIRAEIAAREAVGDARPPSHGNEANVVH
jgi:hypothetical protein